MPITNVRTFEWIRSKLSGSEERRDKAAEVLLDVYERGAEDARVVENFIGRAAGKTHISAQPIIDVYEAVNHNPEALKRFLTKRDFAVYEQCHDG